MSYGLTECLHWLLQGRKSAPPHRLFTAKISFLFFRLRWHIPLAVLSGLVIWLVLYTSFFSNMKGLGDSFRTYMFWTREGLESGHVKTFSYYVHELLVRYELAIVLLSYIGLMAALFRNDKKGLFLMFWTLGTVGFYSLVPYKTPWLIVNLVMPMALMAGYGIQFLLDTVQQNSAMLNKKTAAVLVGLLAALPFFFQWPQTFKMAYKEYDADRHPQVYAHTSRSVFLLLDEIKKRAQPPLADKNININIFTEKYWPLPFYLMDFPHVNYFGGLNGVNRADAELIIADPSKKDQLANLLKDTYTQKQYSLRSGVPLVLYTNHKILVSSQVVTDLKISQSPASPLSPGLKKEMYGNPYFSAEPSVVSQDTSFNFTLAATDPKPFTGPFSVKWTGFIDIKKAGIYKFSLESDDGSWLSLDDRLIVDNGGEHARARNSGQANLSAGFHRMELRYFDIGGEAVLQLFWTPPHEPESLVPRNVFFNVPSKS